MKLYRLLPFPLLLLVSITVNAQWRGVAGDEFKIDFPAQPKGDVFTITERGQTARADRLTVKTQAGLFQIYSLLIPYAATMQDRLDSAFGHLKQTDKSIHQISRREFTFMGCEAGEFQGRTQIFPLMAMRIIVTPEKIYILAVVVTQNTGRGQVQRFMDSFKLNAPCQP